MTARHTAATYQHQRQHDARSDAQSCERYSSDGPGLLGVLVKLSLSVLLVCPLGAVFGGDKDAVTAPEIPVTAENCSRYLTATEYAPSVPYR